MAGALGSRGLIGALSDAAKGALDAANLSWPAAFAVLHVTYFIVHYLFASQVRDTTRESGQLERIGAVQERASRPNHALTGTAMGARPARTLIARRRPHTSLRSRARSSA